MGSSTRPERDFTTGTGPERENVPVTGTNWNRNFQEIEKQKIKLKLRPIIGTKVQDLKLLVIIV